MKHLRVFTILLCLTLSITILSACGDKEPNANSNPSSASGGSTQSENAQNSDAPEEDAPSIELADMAWSIDGITYFFYTDGTLEVTDGTDSVFGGYEWDGQAGLITLDGFIVELLLDGEGDLYIEGEDGEYYLMTYAGFADGGDHESGGMPNPDDTPDYDLDYNLDYDTDDDGSIGYEALDNGKIRFYDYDNNVSITYPEWMSCMEDANPGTVTITDGNGGYVVGENITDMYWNYSGSDDEMIAAYMNELVTVYFEELYGDGWEVFYLNNMSSDESNRIATAEMNLYNDDYDIYIRTLIYHTVQNGENTGTVMAKTFFASFDDYNDGGSQFQTLYDEVRNLVPVQ